MSMRPTVDDVREEYVATVATAMAQKDAAYRERDQLVAALSKEFPAHLARHDPLAPGYDAEYSNIVCVHLPTGQATWHIPDSELPLFDHLGGGDEHWDGHDTEEKYRRLNALLPVGHLPPGRSGPVDAFLDDPDSGSYRGRP
jgi:hypothetical protein